MKKPVLLLIALAISFALSFAQNGGNLMPMPQKINSGTEKLTLTPDFTLSITGTAADFVYDRADDFLRRLAGRTGLFIRQERVRPGQTPPVRPVLVIEVEEEGQLGLKMEESYTLKIGKESILLRAKTSYGAIRGLETLLQWLDTDSENYFFAEVYMEDFPRFPWRGLLIDPARHWLPVEVIKRNIDGMAAVKMNVLHLHLTEDQGFRIESKAFPRLHQMGGEGQYYTQEQMRDLIQYAADRGIRIVPEFDIPGHATSWLVGYPELATIKKAYSIEREWGVMDPVLDPSKESTYEFLEIFLSEMAALFPDTYMHIGGDENNGKHWNQAEHIQKFKSENGIADNHELQALFNQRLHSILTKNGKKMVGWDEIQHPEIPKNVVIQSWRGPKGLAEAAQAGYEVMLSNGYYIDLIQPASFHYLNDPLPEELGLSAAEAARVLGGEATMWGEQVTWETIDSRIWPRTAAISERLWSSAEVRDVDDMYQRLESLSLQLEELGLQHEKNYEMMLRRLCRGKGVEELRLLADVSEPVKGYKRNALSEVNALMPYTRFVDATRPDASLARKFNRAVHQMLQGGNPQDLAFIEESLDRWFRNRPYLDPVLEANPILHEVRPLAKNLAVLAFVGQQAVQYLKNQEQAPEAWRLFALEICKQAEEPFGETELMIVSGIKELIESTK